MLYTNVNSSEHYVCYLITCFEHITSYYLTKVWTKSSELTILTFILFYIGQDCQR